MRPAKLLLPFERWPEADRGAWQRAIAAGDILDECGPAARWSDGSKRKVLDAYRRWLGHLALTAPNVLGRDPADRITPDAVRAYVAELQATITPAGTHNYVKNLHDAARVMFPRLDVDWLREVARQLARVVVPSSKRSRLVSMLELQDLAVSLMTCAETDPGLDERQRAILYRDGLIIAFLAARAPRRRTLAAITIDRHLLRHGDGYALVFGACDMKNRQPFETTVPRDLVARVERYLAVHRPRIVGADRHAGLWASAKGRPMTAEAIYARVCLHTQTAFGRSINPHLFRDCLATDIAIHDPGHVRIAAHMLGHADLRTTDRHYNQARAIEAGRRHQRGILDLRRQLHHQHRPQHPKEP
jgi:site-specific recombinase XerD